MKLSNRIQSKTSKRISYFLDNYLPIVIRDNKLFYKAIINLWNGKLDIDFKRKAFYMTDEEFANAYDKLSPMRSTDNTLATNNFVLSSIVGDDILEVGSGNGDMAIEIAKLGKSVTATDLSNENIKIIETKAKETGVSLRTKQVNIEQIPFPDHYFDTTICLHTLEHVRLLPKAIGELKRVTKKRLIIIVPKQRFFKYTADYHLHFWGEPSQLLLTLNIKESNCSVIDSCLCFFGDF